jgi:hypothetical protein
MTVGDGLNFHPASIALALAASFGGSPVSTSLAELATGGARGGADPDTVKKWVSEKTNELEFSEPPASLQHFDIWTFAKADGESSYFGRMPPQIVENLLWFYTEPGKSIADAIFNGDDKAERRTI